MEFRGELSPSGRLSTNRDAETRVAGPASAVQVLFKGYVSDRPALTAKLGVDHALDDSQLIAAAYRAWGEALQIHVSGAYAALCFDPIARTAVLTHDALGVGAAFYRVDANGFAFATNLIDLLTVENTSELDDRYFTAYMANGYVCSESTPFRSIKRLLPGNSLSWTPKGVRAVRGWRVADAPPVRYARPQDYQDAFNALLSGAIASTTPASGNTWVALSGGLDSATVACAAARAEVGGLAGYSLIYPDYEPADESRWMRATTEHCAIPWRTIDAKTALPFSVLPEEFVGEPSPFQFHGALRLARAETLKSYGVTHLLTGDGGDAILATSPGARPTHLADGVFKGRPGDSLAAMTRWRKLAEEPRPWAHWMRHTLIRPTVQHLLGRSIRAQPPLAPPPWVSRDFGEAMWRSVRRSHRLAARCDTPGHQVIADTLWCVALSLDRGQARDPGYETRYPLLHRPLVEFMCGVPWEEKLHPQCDRYLQRRALRGVLPELVRRRAYKTVGTWGFVEGLRRSPMWFEHLCDQSQIVDRGMTTAEDWRRAVTQASLGQTHGDRYFLTAAAIESWLKGLTAWRSAAAATFRPKDLRRGD